MKFTTTTLLGLGLSLASIAVAAPTGGWPGWHKPDLSNSTRFGPIKIAPEFIQPIVVDRPDTDLPQPVHFAGEKIPYQVISVTRINKRGHVEDYDMTEEEELEREMCNVSFWDAVTGSAFEKVYACQYWHNLEDDGWNAGQWEHDGDESD